jgi:hypothetical protein
VFRRYILFRDLSRVHFRLVRVRSILDPVQNFRFERLPLFQQLFYAL